jgi:hypothetical protein
LDQVFFSEIYDQIHYDSISTQGEISLPETKTQKIDNWYLLGLFHKTIGEKQEKPKTFKHLLTVFMNQLNIEDRFISLFLYKLKKVFGTKLNSFYDFESRQNNSKEQHVFSSDEVEFIGEYRDVFMDMHFEYDHLGAFALKLMLDLSHSKIYNYIQGYLPIKKDYFKNEDMVNGN